MTWWQLGDRWLYKITWDYLEIIESTKNYYFNFKTCRQPKLIFQLVLYFKFSLTFVGCFMNPIGIWKMNQRCKKTIFNYLTMVLFASEFGYTFVGATGFLIRGFCVCLLGVFLFFFPTHFTLLTFGL